MRSTRALLVVAAALLAVAAASRPGRDGLEPLKASSANALPASSPRLTAAPVTLLPPYALGGAAGHVPVHESGYFKVRVGCGWWGEGAVPA